MERDFKGVWIPVALYLDHSLSWTEKMLIVEIYSLDRGNGCSAGNEHFSEHLGITCASVKNMITKLSMKGLIERTGKDPLRSLRVIAGPLSDSKRPVQEELLSVEPSSKKTDPTNYESILEEFYKRCPSFPRVRTLNAVRKKTIKSRIEELVDGKPRGAKGIFDVFDRAERSDFLSGRTKSSGQYSNWRADFDFIMSPSGMAKIEEGKYDNKKGSTSAKNSNAAVEGF